MNTHRVIYRKKVFIIPFYNNKVMCVKDKITKEWGFLSGGVKEKKRESYIQAAERELSEETSNILKYIPRNHKAFDFITDYRPLSQIRRFPDKRESVKSKYKVYIFELNLNQIKDLENNFVPNSEIEAVKVAPYMSFKKRWVVCDEFWEYYHRFLKTIGDNIQLK